ncbi:TraB/GumN family protein [Rhizobium sp. TRM95111]|uniref:TraB/GumN family protein n=1 Tax=Rhizobium alarense TaxID=2846851 RepID=UPI001F41ED9B|nr:TraB/GumN family protein [Rhizobium alarense]MCF3639988.1 TraB/GumN family protein [Rhizobium alarense]
MTTSTHRTGAKMATALTDGLLWLAAGLNWLVLISLAAVLASLSDARAETLPSACGGRDLVAEIKQDDPAAFAALKSEADAAENGKGIFWRIEKAGTAPSYLLGTMHVTDPRVLAMPDGARAAFDGASTVVVESDEIADEKKAGAALLSRPDLTMFTDGRSITGLLSDADERTLADGLQRRGLSLPALNRMKPWMLMSFVALPACELARKSAGAAFLDQKLARDALAAGKTLKGLETLIEQITALDSLPIEPQLQGLVQTVQLGDRIEDVIETMSRLYLAGDTGMIMPMMKIAAPATAGDEVSYAEFEQRIIIDRNHRMAERAGPILAGGNAFVAVGALHLPGREGVVELLRQQGFTVTAVD